MTTTKTDSKRYFWMPTKPYSLTDAINRMAAATGSVRRAMNSEGADFNGNSVSMFRSEYAHGSKVPEGVDYWRAYYVWSGPQYVGRGTFAECLRQSLAFFARDGRGADLTVACETDEHVAACVAAGMVEKTKAAVAAHTATYRDDRFDLVNEALRDGTASILLDSKSADEYVLRRESMHADQVTWLTSPEGAKVYFVVKGDRVSAIERKGYANVPAAMRVMRSGGRKFLREYYCELRAAGYR